MTVTVAIALGFAVAAAAGAAIRFGLSSQLNRSLPYGTLLVNTAASLCAGLVAQADDPLRLIVAVAGLGALSTWSSVAAEVATLARADEGGTAILYLSASVTTGVLAAWAGLQLSPFG